jgi:hypothetical protein
MGSAASDLATSRRRDVHGRLHPTPMPARRYAYLVYKIHSYAYYGAHPFMVPYWAAHALDHLGYVILVGDPEIKTTWSQARRQRR